MHAFFLTESPLPEPAQPHLRITSFSGKLIQLVTLPVCYRPLHLAHGYHLLPQVVLVLANATIPPSDCLVLTNQDIFRNLIEQSAGMSVKSINLVEVVVSLPEVVRDDDNTARKCIDGIS